MTLKGNIVFTERDTEYWIRNESDRVAVSEGCYFDYDSADRVREFFLKFIRHSQGQFKGKIFTLIEWQWDRVIAPLYGWKRSTGERRFTRCGIGLPKKNGKSTLLSGLAIYHLIADREPGAGVYSAAGDKAQASIIYRESMAMVLASPALSSRIEIVESIKEFKYRKNNSVYKALSRDVPTKEGLNISCLLFDELHTQRDHELWDTLRYGGASRRQPMLIWISTSGTNKSSLCYEQWTYAKKIQESTIVDTSYLPLIYETPIDADWHDPEVWKAANPSFGSTLNEASFHEDHDEAIRIPSSENKFKRYRLNMWTESESRWISSESWKAAAMAYDDEFLATMPCIVGLDLASTTDVCAMVLVFKSSEGIYYIRPYFWIPEQTMSRREKMNVTRFDDWVRNGFAYKTDKPAIDYKLIRIKLAELACVFDIKEVALDPWNATQIATDLKDDGFKIVYVRQGFASISGATKEYERLVLEGNLKHDDNPVMNWMNANIVVVLDPAGNIKMSKEKSSEKIDGPSATTTAIARWIVQEVPKKSAYNRGGIKSI